MINGVKTGQNKPTLTFYVLYAVYIKMHINPNRSETFTGFRQYRHTMQKQTSHIKQLHASSL